MVAMPTLPPMKPSRIAAQIVMKTKGEGRKIKDGSMARVRATISFPPGVYETLESIAREKKVSLAWVVREAAEKYIADKWPLFSGVKGSEDVER